MVLSEGETFERFPFCCSISLINVSTQPEPKSGHITKPQFMTKVQKSDHKETDGLLLLLAHCFFLLCLKLKLQTVGPCEV